MSFKIGDTALKYGLCLAPMAGYSDRAMRLVCKKYGAEFYAPTLNLCGDNAAMIGAQGYYEYLKGERADESLNAYPS